MLFPDAYISLVRTVGVKGKQPLFTKSLKAYHRARVQRRALRVTDLGHHALGHLVSISNDASLVRQLQALHSSRCVANPLHFSDLSINKLDRVSIQLSTGRRIVDVLR
jgi:hypothetical protein